MTKQFEQPPGSERLSRERYWWQTLIGLLKKVAGRRERKLSDGKETPLSAGANGTLVALRQRVLVGIVDGQRIYGNGRVRKLERRR